MAWLEDYPLLDSEDLQSSGSQTLFTGFQLFSQTLLPGNDDLQYF